VVFISRRTPRNYNGTQTTTHRVSDLLPHVLGQISEVYQDNPELILAAWPDIIGEKLASMTQAVSFSKGVLTVKVQNSTLYALLSRQEKPRILNLLKKKFPKIEIKIQFRMG
jgi:hypothetical protein